MRALSIRQPWAYAILALGKRVENRVWETSHRGPILIHASASGTKREFDAAATEVFAITNGLGPLPPLAELSLGGVVGIARVVDVVLESPSLWAMAGHFHWVIEDAIALPFVPFKGEQRLFEIEVAKLREHAAVYQTAWDALSAKGGAT